MEAISPAPGHKGAAQQTHAYTYQTRLVVSVARFSLLVSASWTQNFRYKGKHTHYLNFVNSTNFLLFLVLSYILNIATKKFFAIISII
jgi:hypothetical protein